jgi:hypothetical protein
MQRPAQGALEALLVEPQGAVLDAGLAPDAGATSSASAMVGTRLGLT